MNSSNVIWFALLLLVLALLIVTALRLHYQVKRLRKLADEAELSKQQIIIEQDRNRQLKQEMTNNIAHELKTPVSSIRGYLEILLSGKPIDDTKRNYFLERCYSQTLRLSGLINDVALINKLEESTDLFPKEAIDVKEKADEAIRELEETAASRHTVIKNQLPQDLTINGNSSLLYSIFRNLVENSLFYAGDGIEIVIECYKPADSNCCYLHYYDTGCGVDSIYLTKIFDRFLRIDEGRSRKNGGSGLGLSIVKHAVLFHGGDIYAKNREGGGLEFFFSLNFGTNKTHL